jgi:hypothetical protein|tara:strand:- start:890 stop:1240 length:351 start_codon:yes stop_codon:yes gene_type:complete
MTKNKYTVTKVVKDTTSMASKAVKLGFVGLGFGLGLANRALDTALDGIKEGNSLSKKEERSGLEDSPESIDTQQAIEDVRQNMFERYMEQNPEGSWELFQQEYHYLFHPDEMEGEK